MPPGIRTCCNAVSAASRPELSQIILARFLQYQAWRQAFCGSHFTTISSRDSCVKGLLK